MSVNPTHSTFFSSAYEEDGPIVSTFSCRSFLNSRAWRLSALLAMYWWTSPEGLYPPSGRRCGHDSPLLVAMAAENTDVMSPAPLCPTLLL